MTRSRLFMTLEVFFYERIQEQNESTEQGIMRMWCTWKVNGTSFPTIGLGWESPRFNGSEGLVAPSTGLMVLVVLARTCCIRAGRRRFASLPTPPPNRDPLGITM